MDPDTDNRHHRQLTNGQDTWRARYVETHTPGSEGGSGKRTGGNTSTAPGAYLPAGEHRRAHAQWRLATGHARRAGAADKLAGIGYSRTRQHQHLGRAADAVATIGETQSVTAGKVTPTVKAMLASEDAVSLAMLGDQPGALAALRRAEDAFARREPAADSEWVWFFDPAEFAARTGKAHLWLARSDPQYAEEALRRSTLAITSYPKGMVRGRAIVQADLAVEHALAGDPAQAVVEGRRALAAAGELRSRRLLDWLASLPADLAPYRADDADVRDLVHDIRAARPGSPA